MQWSTNRIHHLCRLFRTLPHNLQVRKIDDIEQRKKRITGFSLESPKISKKKAYSIFN